VIIVFKKKKLNLKSFKMKKIQKKIIKYKLQDNEHYVFFILNEIIKIKR
jgi:hypothetical protein